MTTAMIVHGGAGLYSDAPADEIKAGCEKALRAGLGILEGGGSAVEAVEAAVRALEDDPQFNAGQGSVLNADGQVEMDACLMAGDLRAGGVAAVQHIKNPISLARMVMERTRHVLLVGDGAEQFAKAQEVALCRPEDLVTARQLERWQKAREEADPSPAERGTVGAVARDAQGRFAAATSTGGVLNKLRGRVGDSPIPGAGTYADDQFGAASATGLGEAILTMGLSRRAVELLAAGMTPMEAAEKALFEMTRRTGAQGGLIVISRRGEVGWAYNTAKMSRAWLNPEGVVESDLG